MASLYLPLLMLHVSMAVVSPVLFSVRAWRAVRMLNPARGVLRWIPHTVDTILLLAGGALAVAIREFPFVNAWLTAKLVALVAYIAMGHLAVRRARTRRGKIAAWLIALTIALYIYGVALTKDPTLAPLRAEIGAIR